MKTTRITQALAVGALTVVSSAGLAAEPSKLGEQEFRSSCAVCHGQKASGNGAFDSMMVVSVPNLTVLAKTNSGVFPFKYVYETIDGTQAIKAHGLSDMPIWGQRYRVEAAKHFVDIPYDERAFVRARILALTEYLSTVQVK